MRAHDAHRAAARERRARSADTRDAAHSAASGRVRRAAARPAALYLWNLSASGWANSFYSAAAQAGSQSWTAMLFGSTDAANAITVDKTPAALWVMDAVGAAVRAQPVERAGAAGTRGRGRGRGAVRRRAPASGPRALRLLAGAVLALTPVAALMFRFNNPDALLVLAARRRRLLRAACLRKGQRPLVVAARGCRGRVRHSWPRWCRRSWWCPVSPSHTC